MLGCWDYRATKEKCILEGVQMEIPIFGVAKIIIFPRLSYNFPATKQNVKERQVGIEITVTQRT